MQIRVQDMCEKVESREYMRRHISYVTIKQLRRTLRLGHLTMHHRDQPKKHMFAPKLDPTTL